jgi:hypothetical protein
MRWSLFAVLPMMVLLANGQSLAKQDDAAFAPKSNADWFEETAKERADRESCRRDLICAALDNPNLKGDQEVAKYVNGICDTSFLRRFSRAAQDGGDVAQFAKRLSEEVRRRQDETMEYLREMKSKCKPP